MQQEKQEQVFLNEQGVRVTNSRFILPKQTFAMSGITSVGTSIEKPKRLGAVVLLATGVVLLIGVPQDTWLFDVICIAIGAAWFASQKSIYHVQLNTASGEAKALSSKDAQWIERVVHSLNEAIVHRG